MNSGTDHRHAQAASRPTDANRALVGVLLLAWVVRMLGPLREAALGQTDAYAHLQFLNDMLSAGRLRHAYYPPGYYWLLALPARLLPVDPYWIARFAGALFGAGLVGALFVLARRAFGCRAALWAAFLAAAFPAFHWLQKTGVGAYPSQLGLLLAPLLLLAWDGALRGRPRSWAGLAGAFLLLAISVPMMLLDLLPLLALDFAVRAGKREIGRFALIMAATAAVAAAGGLIALSARIGGATLADTACAVAGVPRPDGPAWLALMRVAAEYAAPLRWGPAGWLFQIGALGIGALLIALSACLWRRNAAARMIALWALLAWAQSVFGLFQFALYLRAGWMLLAALAVLGGWLIEWTAARLPAGSRRVALGALAASALVTFIFPPLPRPHLSPAETDLVIVARRLAAWSAGRDPGPVQEGFSALDRAGNLTVWSRYYNATHANQGDPLHAFLETRSRLAVRSVSAADAAHIVFEPDSVHLVLLDDQAVGRAASGLMRVVNPDLTADFERHRARLMEAAPILRQRIEQAEQDGWTVTRRRLPQGLEMVWLRRDG